MVDTDSKKELAAALNRLETLKRKKCFDPMVLDSKPTQDQLKVLQDARNIQHRYVLGGNQCLAKGTLVPTTAGLCPIESLEPGDEVFDEHGKPIKVLQTFSNGVKLVRKLTHRGMVLAECTDNHVFLTRNSSKAHLGPKELPVNEFGRDTQIKRVEIEMPSSGLVVEEAYAIGAMLGDGCCRNNSFSISSADEEIVAEVAKDLQCTYKKQTGNNYTWVLNKPVWTNRSSEILYAENLHGKYSHEKTLPPNVKNWCKESKLRLLAGLIDTDGSVYVDSWNNLCIAIEMQAKTVIEMVQYLFLELFQTQVSIYTNDRDKFVNGPTYSLRVANNEYSKRILKALPTVCSRKQYKPEYEDLVSTRTSSGWVGAKRSMELREEETYDIHVDSPTNLYCLANGLVTHNSGKSLIGGREVSWVLQEQHPYFSRPKNWTEPLTILVVARTSKIYEHTLWEGKIKPFLPAGSYRERREAGVLQVVEYLPNGNKILFFSHHSPEEAREKVQSYVAHWVWLDEMPRSFYLIEELHRRVQAKQGRFIATFTPKIINEKIRQLVDTPSAVHKKYHIKMLDNPIYSSRKEEVLASMATMSEEYRHTVLDGAWYSGEQAVYEFNRAKDIAEPPGYHPSWRHIESVDPAAVGKLGFVLIAEHPLSGIWFVVKVEYLKGNAATVLLDDLRKRTAGYNIVARTCDSHEGWFMKEASIQGRHYIPVWSKTNRKKELIKNVQEFLLAEKLKVSPWCTDLLNEFYSCQWSDKVEDKIVGASSYHLLDALQYAIDPGVLPKFVSGSPSPVSHDAALKHANRERIKNKTGARMGRFRRPKIWKGRRLG